MSTEDQIELFRAYAARHGFEFIGACEDIARSGASVLDRDGLMRLVHVARQAGSRALARDRFSHQGRARRGLGPSPAGRIKNPDVGGGT